MNWTKPTFKCLDIHLEAFLDCVHACMRTCTSACMYGRTSVTDTQYAILYYILF